MPLLPTDTEAHVTPTPATPPPEDTPPKRGPKPPIPRPRSAPACERKRAVRKSDTADSWELSGTDTELEPPTLPQPSKLNLDDTVDMAEHTVGTPDAAPAVITPVSNAKDQNLIRGTSKPDLFQI